MPLSWLLRRPALDLRPVHVSDRDPDLSWAHAIELDDPAPFLRGGELVLTTGLRLPRAAAGQAAYVDRLVEAGAAALGLGTGLRHARVPAGIRRACEAVDLPLVEVPLATPFIAVSQAVADRLGELRRLRLTETMDQQRALSRAAVRGGVDAVVRTLARQLAAGVYLCDRTWREQARAGAARALPERLEALLGSGRRGAVSEASPTGWTEVQPVGERPVARLGWLALSRAHPLSVPERLVLTHAVSLVLLLLDRPEDAVPEAEADLVRLLLDATDAPAATVFGAGRAVCVLVANGPRHRLLTAVEEARRSAPHAVRAEVAADARLLVVDAEVEGVVATLLEFLGTDGRVGIGPPVGVVEAASTLTAARRACDAAHPGAARRSADLPVTASPDPASSPRCCRLEHGRSALGAGRQRPDGVPRVVPDPPRQLGSHRGRPRSAPAHGPAPNPQGGGTDRSQPRRPRGPVAAPPWGACRPWSSLTSPGCACSWPGPGRRLAGSARIDQTDPVTKPVHLDDKSKEIIALLQKDGRMSYTAIANEVGLSEAAVRQRAQRLMEQGVMQIVAVTDPLQLGFAWEAMIGVRVSGNIEAIADDTGRDRGHRLHRPDRLASSTSSSRWWPRATTS